ncbi:MAG: DUF4230 domain-containing protein [Bacteroidales bacterium]|nr:DUF4230 domain-containing protein [Bacteroidales bacterium]
MKYIVRLTVTLLLLVSAAVGGIYIYRHFTAPADDTSGMEIGDTRIEGIREMVKLCTLEIEDEVALRDSINGKWLFAKARLTGEVSFDAEKLQWDTRGDTLVITLPPETVAIRESTLPGSYQVIDTWDDSLFGLGKLTTAEENALKRRLIARYRSDIYRKGYVERARANALRTLRQLTAHLNSPQSVIIN